MTLTKVYSLPIVCMTIYLINLARLFPVVRRHDSRERDRAYGGALAGVRSKVGRVVFGFE